MNGFKFLLRLGVSLSWVGFVPSNFSLNSSTGIYSIDGQTPISFFIPALESANALPLYNQIIFDTQTLSPGQPNMLAALSRYRRKRGLSKSPVSDPAAD
jgi:hypothetical protein